MSTRRRPPPDGRRARWCGRRTSRCCRAGRILERRDGYLVVRSPREPPAPLGQLPAVRRAARGGRRRSLGGAVRGRVRGHARRRPPGLRVGPRRRSPRRGPPGVRGPRATSSSRSSACARGRATFEPTHGRTARSRSWRSIRGPQRRARACGSRCWRSGWPPPDVRPEEEPARRVLRPRAPGRAEDALQRRHGLLVRRPGRRSARGRRLLRDRGQRLARTLSVRRHARGLASPGGLLTAARGGLPAQRAPPLDVERFVIAADAGYHAAGLYESLGFEAGRAVAGVCLAREGRAGSGAGRSGHARASASRPR